MNLLQQMQSSKILAVVIVASIVFLDYTLTGAIVPIVPTLLWKIHLRSQLDLKESSHLDTSTNATSEATTVNMTLISPTATAQNLQEAEKAYLATQGVKIAAIFAAKTVTEMITDLFVGPLIDRIGHSVPMFAGAVFLCTAAIGFALGQSYAVLLVSPAVQGIGSACNTAAGMTMLARTFPEEEQRGKIIGITFGMLGVGSAFGPPYGSVMTAFTGKEATFFLLAGLIALFGILQLFYNCLKIERIEQDEKPKNMWILLKDIDILIYLGVIFMGSVILGALNGTFTTWLIERFHPHNWELGLAFLPLFGLFGLASNMINFTPLKRWPIAVAVLGSVIFCIGLVALPFTPSFVSTIGPTLVIGLGIGLVTGSIYPDLAVLSETRHDSDYGNVYALADIAIMVGFFVGPLMGAGIVHALNFSWMMWILAIVSIVYALALAVRFYVTKKKATQVEETQQLLDEPINKENNDEKEVS
ncbi:unnamed protein product [Clavelina lepadiformis]|uniref:Major facilitator superfamily (MFS) profile domain-containing protein n=1 Tax=Clavelina lepadiformis TaxID=159417 RepID=A0ABP0G3B9_CLALP